MSWEPDDMPDVQTERSAPPAADSAPLRRRRGRGRGRVMAVIFALLAVLLVGGGAGLFLYARAQLAPVSGDHGHTVEITVTQGEPVDAVFDDLARNGLIHGGSVFSLYARFKGLTSVAPGRYLLDSGMSAGTIIDRLQTVPEVKTVTLTFREGLTATQMAALVEASGVGVTAQQYMAEVTKGSFAAPFLAHRPAGASLEGFLFPDTYVVALGATAHDIVQMQLGAFASKAAPLLMQIPAAQTDYQVLTVASIVEREARFPDDRGLVAGVIDNRLAANMKLEVDATVIYGLGKTSGEPTADELQQDTPYNTYIHPGLPPTPISNPGVAAITAAARPSPSPYLYYVSDGCGHNHYASTLAEHQRNVQLYVGTPCATPT